MSASGFSMRRLLRLGLACAGILAAGGALAQDRSLLAYEGADRTDKVVEAAKKEGRLTLYTAFRPQDLPALIEPFEKAYGIKVTAWRSGKDNVLQRVLKEAKGQRYEVDAILIPSTEMEALRREKLLHPVKSPFRKDLLPEAVPAHGEWSPVLLNVLVPTYNTRAIRKEDLPRTYQDLLDPKWKGKLGVEAGLDDWYMTTIRSMGESEGRKLFAELSAKNGLSARLGMSLLHNLVISGEVPLALAVYRDLPEKAKRKGADIDWFVLEPTVAQAFVVSIAARAAQERGPAVPRLPAVGSHAEAAARARFLSRQREGAAAAAGHAPADGRPGGRGGRRRARHQGLGRHAGQPRQMNRDDRKARP